MVAGFGVAFDLFDIDGNVILGGNPGKDFTQCEPIQQPSHGTFQGTHFV